MTTHRFRLGIAALLWLLCTAPTVGCSTFEGLAQMDRTDEFDVARQHFTQYVRYGRIAKAAQFVTDEQLEEFLSLEPQVADFRLTDYEVVTVDLDEEARTATVDVRFSGYVVSEMVERNVEVTQNWAHDDESGEWKVTLEIAAIRRGLSASGN